ncbi:DUF2127 domain-containing protein [Pandoraea commovens]|uniref:DUF2127 domain-containing protein n=1 Tax=Pandoraea commovens TaxID=2508289 RepID=A0ABY5QMM5_9BURK|nr:DUF2127 domain-containing protein [Pandoraea commovens]UVA81894.1 DUF2127 domain-containing protein [Pandoraea commovens]
MTPFSDTTEKRLHWVFETSLWIKALFALSEILAGVLAYFVPTHVFLSIVLRFSGNELTEDPHDIVAGFLLHAVQHLSVGSQKFAAIYLLAHGIVKFWLIVGLLRERLWYFPVSMVAFALFIAYQLYRYTYTHSIWLLLLSALDLGVIVLTWHEYRHVKQQVLARSVPQIQH